MPDDGSPSLVKPSGNTSWSGLSSGNCAYIMLRGRLNTTDRPVRVFRTRSMTESVRTPSRLTDPSPPRSRMLTCSRPPHGSSSLMPRGAVAVRFSVKSVSTRSACTAV